MTTATRGDDLMPWPETLRDYFAAKAMAAILSRQDFSILFKPVNGPPEWNAYSDDHGRVTTGESVLAQLSYDAADAMLKAREVK